MSGDVLEALLGAGRQDDPMAAVSPLLVFAVVVYPVAHDLLSASYVPERVGIGRRFPVFDVASLREFISSP